MASPTIIGVLMLTAVIFLYFGVAVSKDPKSAGGWLAFIVGTIMLVWICYGTKGGDCTAGQYCSPIPAQTVPMP